LSLLASFNEGGGRRAGWPVTHRQSARSTREGSGRFSDRHRRVEGGSPRRASGRRSRYAGDQVRL